MNIKVRVRWMNRHNVVQGQGGFFQTGSCQLRRDNFDHMRFVTTSFPGSSQFNMAVIWVFRYFWLLDTNV